MISNKEKYESVGNLLIYKIAISILLLLSIFTSIFLVPFFMIKNSGVYYVIFFIGLSFGFILNLIIREIEEISQGQKTVALFFIPVFCLLNILVLAGTSDKVSAVLNVEMVHNQGQISIIYITSFLIPFVLNFFKTKKIIL